MDRMKKGGKEGQRTGRRGIGREWEWWGVKGRRKREMNEEENKRNEAYKVGGEV